VPQVNLGKQETKNSEKGKGGSLPPKNPLVNIYKTLMSVPLRRQGGGVANAIKKGEKGGWLAAQKTTRKYIKCINEVPV